jgi:hypothetical protein
MSILSHGLGPNNFAVLVRMFSCMSERPDIQLDCVVGRAPPLDDGFQLVLLPGRPIADREFDADGFQFADCVPGLLKFIRFVDLLPGLLNDGVDAFLPTPELHVLRAPLPTPPAALLGGRNPAPEPGSPQALAAACTPPALPRGFKRVPRVNSAPEAAVAFRASFEPPLPCTGGKEAMLVLPAPEPAYAS